MQLDGQSDGGRGDRGRLRCPYSTAMHPGHGRAVGTGVTYRADRQFPCIKQLIEMHVQLGRCDLHQYARTNDDTSTLGFPQLSWTKALWIKERPTGMKLIESVLKPIVKPIIKRFIRPLRSVKKWPKLLVVVLRNFVKKVLFPQEITIKHYMPIGQYYIAYRLLMIILIVILVLMYFIYVKPPKIFKKLFNRPTIVKADTPTQESGAVQVRNDQGFTIYDGEMAAGVYEGQGKLYDQTGQLMYEGAFAAGQRNGEGSLYNDQGGLMYKGGFSAGLYSGTGTLFNADQSVRYEGGFQNGKYGGEGKEYYDNGQLKYEGSFSSNQYNGPGKLFSEDGVLLYEGEFNANQYNGAGKLFGLDGKLLYEGGFVAGAYSGEGTEYYPNGMVKYTGAFQAGTYSGAGTFHYETGTPQYTGTFFNGMLNGKGEMFDSTGALSYTGDFRNGQRDGLGTLTDSLGTTLYKGFFRQDNVYMEGFLGLATTRVEEILEGAGEVSLISPIFDLEAPLEETTEDVTAASTEPPVLSTSYADLGLAFRIELPDPAAKQSVVTEVTSWSLPVISEMYTAMETMALEQTEAGDPQITRQATLFEDGRDALVYTMDAYEYTYLFNRTDGSLGELRIRALVTGTP